MTVIMGRATRALVLLVSLGACAGTPPVGSAANTLPAAREGELRWPSAYRPNDAGFFVHNVTEIDAPPEVVWDVLVEAASWPSWYEGAADVSVEGRADGRLAPGARFTWETMGLRFTSTIEEFEPPRRLAWESRKASIQGYHTWLVVPTSRGSRLVTAESQHGILTVAQKIFVPSKLRRLHDVWLAKIKARAEARAPRTPREVAGPDASAAGARPQPEVSLPER